MKKVVLAVLIATLMIASRPMTTEAADQSINPICTDLSVKKDLAKEDEHVPIYCTWSGTWVDQHGHDISWHEGEKYLAKPHKPGEAQKEVEATEQTITPPKKEVDVSLDYNALTEYIVSCDHSIYSAYVAKMRSVAIESLRGNEVWCDACYTLFKTDLSNPENRWALGRIFTDDGDIGKYECILSGVPDTPDNIIAYREHDITFFQGRKVFCLEGHMVGKVHGSDIDYSGPFADAINQKLEELLEK